MAAATRYLMWVVALAFTQGINEQQSLAHRVARSCRTASTPRLRRAAAFTQELLLGASAVQRDVLAPVRAEWQQQWWRQQEEEGQQGGGGGGETLKRL